MDRSNVLGCGCYASAVPDEGVLRWLRWPSPMGGLAMFHETTAAFLERRGWAKVNGLKATVKREHPDCPHRLTLWFGGTWNFPHPGPQPDPSYGRQAA